MNFICPMPMKWNALYKELCIAYEKKIQVEKELENYKLPKTVTEIRKVGGPPTPLILNGWVFSNDIDKRARWIETIEWAKSHNLSHVLVVDEKDMYYGDEK